MSNQTWYFSVALAYVLGLPIGQLNAQTLQDYRCRIELVTMPGLVPKASADFWQKTYVGKEFSVERRTGVMAGALKNSFVTKPEVIDQGSEMNSFKVVATMRRDQGAGAGSNVYLLVIREFEKGAEKPFLFIDNDEIYSGTCKHF